MRKGQGVPHRGQGVGVGVVAAVVEGHRTGLEVEGEGGLGQVFLADGHAVLGDDGRDVGFGVRPHAQIVGFGDKHGLIDRVFGHGDPGLGFHAVTVPAQEHAGPGGRGGDVLGGQHGIGDRHIDHGLPEGQGKGDALEPGGIDHVVGDGGQIVKLGLPVEPAHELEFPGAGKVAGDGVGGNGLARTDGEGGHRLLAVDEGHGEQLGEDGLVGAARRDGGGKVEAGLPVEPAVKGVPLLDGVGRDVGRGDGLPGPDVRELGHGLAVRHKGQVEQLGEFGLEGRVAVDGLGGIELHLPVEPAVKGVAGPLRIARQLVFGDELVLPEGEFLQHLAVLRKGHGVADALHLAAGERAQREGQQADHAEGQNSCLFHVVISFFFIFSPAENSR